MTVSLSYWRMHYYFEEYHFDNLRVDNSSWRIQAGFAYFRAFFVFFLKKLVNHMQTDSTSAVAWPKLAKQVGPPRRGRADQDRRYHQGDLGAWPYTHLPEWGRRPEPHSIMVRFHMEDTVIPRRMSAPVSIFSFSSSTSRRVFPLSDGNTSSIVGRKHITPLSDGNTVLHCRTGNTFSHCRMETQSSIVGRETHYSIVGRKHVLHCRTGNTLLHCRMETQSSIE
jgi:hypothetical protein